MGVLVFLVGFYFQDDIIKQIANGGVAEAQFLRHDLEAAAALYKFNDKILLLLCKAGQKRQAEYTGYFGSTFITYQGFYLQRSRATWANMWQVLLHIVSQK